MSAEPTPLLHSFLGCLLFTPSVFEMELLDQDAIRQVDVWDLFGKDFADIGIQNLTEQKQSARHLFSGRGMKANVVRLAYKTFLKLPNYFIDTRPLSQQIQ